MFSTIINREERHNIAWRVNSEFCILHLALVRNANTEIMESGCLPFKDWQVAGA